MNIAIIPARGGSKRIPRKNIKDFCGKPIIAYSIEVALESGLFDKVIVSTDDNEIAEIAKKYGAEVPFIRPIELANDYIGTTAVIESATTWYKDKGINVVNVCCIYPTAPLLKKEYLIKGLENLSKTNCHMSFSATSFAFPIQRALRFSENNGVAPVCSEDIGSRSQDLEDTFHDAGQFYWAEEAYYNNNYTFFSKHSIPVILPRYLVQDIDNDEDWIVAEALYKINSTGK